MEKAVGQRRCVCVCEPLRQLPCSRAPAGRQQQPEAHTRNREHFLAAHRAERAFSRCALHLPLYFGYCLAVAGKYTTFPLTELDIKIWWTTFSPLSSARLICSFVFFCERQRERRKPDNLRACHVGLRDFARSADGNRCCRVVDACLLSFGAQLDTDYFAVARGCLNCCQRGRRRVFFTKIACRSLLLADFAAELLMVSKKLAVFAGIYTLTL